MNIPHTTKIKTDKTESINNYTARFQRSHMKWDRNIWRGTKKLNEFIFTDRCRLGMATDIGNIYVYENHLHTSPYGWERLR